MIAPESATRRGNVCGVMVTFHPDSVVEASIRAAALELAHLVIVDNTPSHEVTGLLDTAVRKIWSADAALPCSFPRLIQNGSNRGLAEALNQAVDEALRLDTDFVLFLDQDSQILPGAVDRLVSAYFGSRADVNVGAMVATNVDPNRYLVEEFHVAYAQRRGGYVARGVKEVFWAKTSGTMIPREVLERLGPFRIEYFIDEIDHEYCFRLRAQGYRILWVPDAQLGHTLGVPIQIGRGPVRISMPMHAAWRNYYRSRNLIWTVRSYFSRFPLDATVHWAFATSLSLLVALASPERAAALRNAGRGTLDGLRGPETGRVVHDGLRSPSTAD